MTRITTAQIRLNTILMEPVNLPTHGYTEFRPAHVVLMVLLLRTELGCTSKAGEEGGAGIEKGFQTFV